MAKGKKTIKTKPPSRAAAKPSSKPRPGAAQLNRPAIRIVMMPRDTNPVGSIFGGHILSLIDLAAGQHARSVAPKTYLTKVIREVEFIAPVFVGDSVSFNTETIAMGRSSITIKVDVEATRGLDLLKTIHVTSAEVVMVAVDRQLRPTAILGSAASKHSAVTAANSVRRAARK